MTLALHGKSKTRQTWLISIAVAVVAFAALAGAGALLGGGDARASGTVVVTGNTATYYNEPGKWLFNADPVNATPYEFTTTAASFGSGSLYVKPIGATPCRQVHRRVLLGLAARQRPVDLVRLQDRCRWNCRVGQPVLHERLR